MAGLLDDAFGSGDPTAKDEYGLTRTDRSQPLWDSLIKTGLLAVAAGQNITPAARAQMIGQMGGTLGGITDDQEKMRANAMQAQLRRQTILTGQQKIANQAKMSAYANSPEGQAALKDLPPAIAFAAKAALDSGDADSFARIISNQSTQKLDIAKQNQDLKEREFELKRKLAEGGGAMTPAKAWQIINNAATSSDPNAANTAEYRAAHTLLSNPHQTRDANGQLVDMPGFDLSWAPAPTFTSANAPGGGSRAPTPVPGQAPKALDDTEVKAIGQHLGSLQKIEDINTSLEKNPNIKLGNAVVGLAAGVAPEMVNAALNAADPEGRETRANIANIGSMIIKDRSGAAVAIHEMARLAPFIPGAFDDAATVRSKLASLQKGINLETKLYYDNLKAGSRAVPPDLEQRMRNIGQGGAVIPPGAIQMLENDPSLAKDFDAKYGKGASNRVLGR